MHVIENLHRIFARQRHHALYARQRECIQEPIANGSGVDPYRLRGVVAPFQHLEQIGHRHEIDDAVHLNLRGADQDPECYITLYFNMLQI